MKIKFLLIIAFLSLSICNSLAQDTLTILHLNDTHSMLSSVGPRNESLQGTQGGIARAATVIGLTKMTDPNVLTLHAGDAFVGDLFFNKYFGAAEFQILNSLGLDAMTIGYHDWDLYPSTLLGSFQASFSPGEGFPFLSANLIILDTAVQELQDYVFPYTTKQLGNIKVGIFGLTTPLANIISFTLPAVYIDTNIVEIASAMVDTLTEHNCDVIILLSHLGLALDQTIASLLPGINVIVSSDDHILLAEPVTVTNPSGGTTWIVQANAHYLDIGKFKLEVNQGQVSFVNYEAIHLDELIPEEPTVLGKVNNLIAEIENDYGPVYTQQIGYASGYFDETADSLVFPGYHDTPLGNLVTDAFRAKTGTDIAIQAGGSTAQPIYPGPLVAADAFRAIGYGFNEVNGLGFRLVTGDILGSEFWKAIETVLSFDAFNPISISDELFPQVSGMKYKYNPNNPPGIRLIEMTVGGKSIDPTVKYSVTGNEFSLVFFSKFLGINVENIYYYEDSTEFQVLAEYISSLQTITPKVEGRVQAVDVSAVEDVRYNPHTCVLKQNYPNPFNPTTNIEFEIANSGLVTLKIYDILGKEVTTILNKELHAGKYNYVWKAFGLSSGIYFYQLKAGEFSDTKKLILMK